MLPLEFRILLRYIGAKWFVIRRTMLLLQTSALAYDGDHASRGVLVKPALGFSLAGELLSERDHPLPSSDCSHPGWAELYRSDDTNEGPHGCGPKRHSEEEPCRASRTLKPRPPSRAQQPRTEPAHLRLPKSRPPPVSAVRN